MQRSGDTQVAYRLNRSEKSNYVDPANCTANDPRARMIPKMDPQMILDSVMILYLTWSLCGLLAFCRALGNLFFSGMWFPTLLGRFELFEAFPATVIQQGMEAVTISWNRSKTQHWLVKVLSTEISQPCLKCFWQNEVVTQYTHWNWRYVDCSFSAL